MSRTRVMFDGYELTRYYYASALRRSLLPRTIGSQDVAGRDGAAFTGVRLAPRTTAMTLTAVSKDPMQREAAARTLAAILATDEPRPLQISIDDGLWCYAVPTSEGEAARYTNALTFDVSFEALDPVMYGRERAVTVPSNSSVTFEVGGTYPTMPIVDSSIACGGGGSWRLALEDGSYLLYQKSGSSSNGASAVSLDDVHIDCASRELTVSGDAALLPPAADWLVLPPGEHTLALRTDGDFSTTGATVTFTERWL